MQIAGDVHALSSKPKQSQKKERWQKKGHSKVDKDSKSTGCGRCGNIKRHNWRECPAREEECRKCHKKGHFAKQCWSAGTVNDITQEREEQIMKDFAFLGEVSSIETNEWIELVRLNGQDTEFKLDTGAAVTAIPESSFSANIHGKLHPPGKVLYGPGNQALEVRGLFQGVLNIKNKRTKQDIYVVKGLSKALLGLPAIEALHLITRLHTVQTKTEDSVLSSCLQRAGKTERAVQD